eukprot:5759020-Alexandrium_andersonii.AAC.1
MPLPAAQAVGGRRGRGLPLPWTPDLADLSLRKVARDGCGPGPPLAPGPPPSGGVSTPDPAGGL